MDGWQELAEDLADPLGPMAIIGVTLRVHRKRGSPWEVAWHHAISALARDFERPGVLDALRWAKPAFLAAWYRDELNVEHTADGERSELHAGVHPHDQAQDRIALANLGIDAA